MPIQFSGRKDTLLKSDARTIGYPYAKERKKKGRKEGRKKDHYLIPFRKLAHIN